MRTIFQLCDIVRETSFAIHKFHGHGHLEKVYENALANRLRKLGLKVEQQHPITVYDEDGTVIGEYFADLFIEDELIIELKAAKSLADEHVAQILGYLKSSGIEHGLLINFGSYRFQIKKYALSTDASSKPRGGKLLGILALLFALFALLCGQSQAQDIVVYGATPGGIASAISAARMGREVVLVEYHDHVGGMAASGLGKSDIENRDMIAGIFTEFTGRVLDHYRRPYRIMVPVEIDGILAPVAASTTHVAFSSIRMEPTWMALGQAAGVAAHLAIEQGVAPRHVPVVTLQEVLASQGQVLRQPARSAQPE